MFTCIKTKKYIKSFNKSRLATNQLNRLKDCLEIFKQGQSLPVEVRDHKLIKEYSDCREFHLGGDMLVIYKKIEETIFLVNIGKHTQVFNSM